MQLELRLFDAEGNPAKKDPSTQQWNAFAHTSKRRRKDRARGFVTIICPKDKSYAKEKCTVLIYPPIALDVMSRREQIRALFAEKDILICDMAITVVRERSMIVRKTYFINDIIGLRDYKNIENVLRRAVLKLLRRAA